MNQSQPRYNTAQIGDSDGSGAMFDRIAPRYDLLNRIISLGLDNLWRKRLLRAIAPLKPGSSILDVATGTADVAIAVAKKFPDTHVVGLDPSAKMLAIGEQKVRLNRLDGRVNLDIGDAQDLPYADSFFAASCISFGIRNVPDRRRALQELSRVTKPGGKIAILELSEPPNTWLGFFAKLHVHVVVPWLGSLLSGASEYRYLQESIAKFPSPDQFIELMKNSGLVHTTAQSMCFGSVQLFTGIVAQRD